MNNKVRGYRNMLNLSQSDMGRILGISKQSFSLKERGKVKFTLEEMRKLKEQFSSILPNITIDEIFLIKKLLKVTVNSFNFLFQL